MGADLSPTNSRKRLKTSESQELDSISNAPRASCESRYEAYSDSDLDLDVHYNCQCKKECLEFMEKMHHPHFVSYDSPRRMNYMKFAEYLQKCKVIKHNMPIDVILESCEVKSFDTTLSEEDKKFCIEMQLHRLALIDLAKQEQIYRKWLLEQNVVVVDICGKTLEEIFKSHHYLFPRLPGFTIKGALLMHMGFIVEADEVKTGLSKGTREEIDKDIEKYYEYEVARAYKIPDRLDWKFVHGSFV